MAKTLAMIFGVVVVALGIIGFFNNPIFGMFEVDAIHNIIHIILGVVLIAGARNSDSKAASMSMRTVGYITLIVAVLGMIFVPVSGKLFGLVTMNAAGNWLHLVLAVILIIAGMKMKGHSSMNNSAPMSNNNPQM